MSAEPDEGYYDPVAALVQLVEALRWRYPHNLLEGEFEAFERAEAAITGGVQLSGEIKQPICNGLGSVTRLPPQSRTYFYTSPVSPDYVVRWFLDIHRHWFEDPRNGFRGMRKLAEAYLEQWAPQGIMPPAGTMLERYLKDKFEEWLKTSWTQAE